MKTLALMLLTCVLTPVHAEECASQSMIVAHKLRTPLDAAGLPEAEAWNSAAAPTVFCADWQGRNSDPQRRTGVRVLWTSDVLYLQFRAHYRALYTYGGGPQRRDKLWDRDVVEVFLQNDTQAGRNYSEIETSPNGDWIDLAITAEGLADLKSDMRSRAIVDNKAQVWTAELAIPMRAIAPSFDPSRPWRVNFFRIEGPEPNRFYSSWQATNTERPNFHVPDVFAPMIFAGP